MQRRPLVSRCRDWFRLLCTSPDICRFLLETVPCFARSKQVQGVSDIFLKTQQSTRKLHTFGAPSCVNVACCDNTCALLCLSRSLYWQKSGRDPAMGLM